MESDQPGHMVVHLVTRCIITHHEVTHIPITQTIISVVKALAKADGFESMQFKTKTGHILWDYAWTAKVDYEEDFYDQDYDNDDIELPGVDINEEEEEQIWQDLDKDKVANLLKDNSVQPRAAGTKS